MAAMNRVIQVPSGGADFETVAARGTRAGSARRPGAGDGLRHLPQRRDGQGGHVGGLSARAGPRDRRRGRRGRLRRRRPGRRASGSGVGWFGGADYTCDACRRGDFIDCANLRTPGLTDDGGYADYAVFPADALAAIPDGVVRHPRRAADVRRRDHLQRAAQLPGPGRRPGRGARHRRPRPPRRPVRGQDGLRDGRHRPRRGEAGLRPATRCAPLHRQHRAGRRQGAAAKLGGASVVLATVTNGPAMAATVPGLRARGELVVLGAAMEPLEVSPHRPDHAVAHRAPGTRPAPRRTPRTRCASRR